jgi:hypothetical protein
MQLVAYGAQDVYLTGDPEITFFKAIYRRHTNFAVESIAQVFNGTTGFGRKATVTVSRNGDLVTNTFLEVKLPALTNGWKWNNNIGHNLIEEVELEIGGQRIDRHYGEWLDIWSELSMTEEKKHMFDSEMIGRHASTATASGAARTLYVPLQFFFNRNQGLALPLIALQYHEVKINFTFASLGDLCHHAYYATPSIGAVPAATAVNSIAEDPSMSLYIDYVYLDTDERKRFAQSQHELLIEQLQFTGDETPQRNGSYRLNFNHPVKELVWVVHQPGKENGNKFNYGETNPRSEPVADANLQLNGHDRFDKREGSYFRLVQPFQHHTRIPKKNIYVYSFAVKPEEHQPSGTCNFSRIDNATLKLTLNHTDTAGTGFNSGDKVKIFATSVNVLRILSGMGGLAYSN